MFQNYRFYAVPANNVSFEFSVADFPLMNLYDLLIVAKILKSVDVLKLHITNKEDFMIRFAHLRFSLMAIMGL